MMDFKEFQDQVLNDMKDRTYGINFDIIQVDKLQGESYTGLSVRPDDSIVSASLNLDQAYGQMMAGKSYEDAFKSNVKTYGRYDEAVKHIDPRAE